MARSRWLRSTRGRGSAAALVGVLVLGGVLAAAWAQPGSEGGAEPELAGQASAAVPSHRATRFIAPVPAPAAANAPVALPSTPSVDPAQIPPPSEWHEFYFTRAAYSSGG
ncbi:MAG: hypothetical protein F4168_02665, partial [Gemmatimonadetes bacterium]|nr:hypothetical protein [Gemmatimonadota bacterium]